MSIFPSTILLATDGSKDAWLATNTAIGLAMVTGSELHVVNVGVVAPTLLKTLDVGPARVEQEARRILDEEVKSIEKVGGTVARSHLRMGDAAQEIVNLAEELKAGLIAVGSRGRGRIKRALIGSVSDSVVRYAHCPVLVARWKPLIFPAQILVATDGSEEATLAAKTAAELAHRTYSELHLVSVADAYSSYYYVQQTGLGDDLPQRAQDVLDDQVKTIEPRPRSIMPGRKLLTVRKVEVRSESITERHCSSAICSVGVGYSCPPANAANTSTGPSSSSTRPRMRSTAAKSVRSAATPRASPPLPRISWTTESIAASSRPLTVTFAPFWASRRQVAAPMPREPPVTTATLFARSG
jgi:nucleotide-binding universal stress UspA family protein